MWQRPLCYDNCQLLNILHFIHYYYQKANWPSGKQEELQDARVQEVRGSIPASYIIFFLIFHYRSHAFIICAHTIGPPSHHHWIKLHPDPTPQACRRMVDAPGTTHQIQRCIGPTRLGLGRNSATSPPFGPTPPQAYSFFSFNSIILFCLNQFNYFY